MLKLKLVKFYSIIILLISFTAKSQSFKAEKLIQGYGVVWSMVQISQDEIIFTTRDGEFKKLNLNTRKVENIKQDLRVLNRGQGGLLDVKLHPDFKMNHKIYFTYSCSKTNSTNTTCLGTGILDKLKLHIHSIKEIFSAVPAIESNQHFGSRIVWDENKNLYMTVGERYIKRELAQDLSTHLGKVLRLDENGKPAAGNPFLKTKNAKPEIYSYGHRNPQGLFYDKESKTLWESEHGAKGGDEINKIISGLNYGWPVITLGVDYNGDKIGEGKEKAGMEQPFYSYVPSIAPSGLLIYSGKKFKSLRGHFLQGSLVLQHLNVVEFVKDSPPKETRLFKDLNERVRDVIELESGDIFFSTDSGKIFQLAEK
jgi:aldose sugar dehydrogenase